MRVFLAVELPGDMKRVLAQIEGQFRDVRPHLRWTEAENLHITLKFLGGISTGSLTGVEQAADAAAAGASPLSLDWGGLGAFPNERLPRVLWVGLKGDGLRGLETLFSRLDLSLAACGFPREQRPFSPHITLARVRERTGNEDRQRVGVTLKRVQSEWETRGTFVVKHLTVMRSQLSSAGPTYTPLHRAVFPGPINERHT